MFSLQYMRAGAVVILPEVSDTLGLASSSFVALGIHEGGMGVCIHVRHEQSGAEYALKAIRPELLGDAEMQLRFADEVKAWLAASACSLVVEALFILRIDNAVTIVSRWMSGGDLSFHLPEMSVAAKLECLLRVVRALQFVNSEFNIIHRDLKPQNILLDRDGRAYLADWGLARPASAVVRALSSATNRGTFDRPDRTSAGAFIGTVLYAAPEQIRGLELIDHRADIYSLGCLMFEMETGQPPFVAETSAEIANMHLTAKPPAIGGLMNQGLLGLSRTIALCLEKTPQERIQTYVELEESLLKAMKLQGGDPTHCTLGIRYKRPILGQGHEAQSELFPHDAPIVRNGLGNVELDELIQHNDEAVALGVLGRHSEAAELLRPYVIAEPLVAAKTWYIHHDVALSYAYFLSQIEGRLENSLEVFGWLSVVQDVPVIFFINYSFALLKAGRPGEALTVCEKGLTRFSTDPGLIGNHTIALRNLGRLEEARRSAFRRLDLRRDGLALEEAGVVCTDFAKRERNVNLPLAIAAAKDAGLLLAEGLLLSRDSVPLWANAIDLRRFANQTVEAAELCNMLYENAVFAGYARELAVCVLLDIMGEYNDLTEFTKFHDKFAGRLQTPVWRKRFDAAKPSVTTDRLFRPNVASRDPLSEDSLQLIQRCLARTGDAYERPVDAGKALAVTDRVVEALATLTLAVAEKPADWDAAHALVWCYCRAGDAIARQKADWLMGQFPWRAEAFDIGSSVYGKFGDLQKSRELKEKGNAVFDCEMKLFDELQQYLDQLTWPAVPT